MRIAFTLLLVFVHARATAQPDRTTATVTFEKTVGDDTKLVVTTTPPHGVKDAAPDEPAKIKVLFAIEKAGAQVPLFSFDYPSSQPGREALHFFDAYMEGAQLILVVKQDPFTTVWLLDLTKPPDEIFKGVQTVTLTVDSQLHPRHVTAAALRGTLKDGNLKVLLTDSAADVSPKNESYLITRDGLRASKLPSGDR